MPQGPTTQALGLVRRLDASGYARVKHWRVYAEEGLARREVAVWLGDGEMAVEHGGRILSRYNVSLSWDAARLEAVTNPRLFATPYGTGQPKLFALDESVAGGGMRPLRDPVEPDEYGFPPTGLDGPSP